MSDRYGHSTGTGQPCVVLDPIPDERGMIKVWFQWDDVYTRRIVSSIVPCEDPAHGEGRVVLNSKHWPSGESGLAQ